jgi:glycosyltransferase involved in cell wall biosynthesis
MLIGNARVSGTFGYCLYGSHGTPILALNRGAIPDFTDNGKFGFVSNKPDTFEIADLIIKAFSNPDQLKKIAEDGQKFVVDNFSWVKIAQNIKSLIYNA